MCTINCSHNFITFQITYWHIPLTSCVIIIIFCLFWQFYIKPLNSNSLTTPVYAVTCKCALFQKWRTWKYHYFSSIMKSNYVSFTITLHWSSSKTITPEIKKEKVLAFLLSHLSLTSLSASFCTAAWPPCWIVGTCLSACSRLTSSSPFTSSVPAQITPISHTTLPCLWVCWSLTAPSSLWWRYTQAHNDGLTAATW